MIVLMACCNRIPKTLELAGSLEVKTHLRRWLALCVASLFLTTSPLWGQPGMGPLPIGVTEAREALVRGVVSLPGSVEARTAGIVASEVEGLVTEVVARAGEKVSRGDTLVRLRRETLEIELRGAEADLAEAAARLALATQNRERLAGLFDTGVISRQDYDAAETEAAAWTGRKARAEATAAQLRDRLDRSRVRAPFSGVVIREHCDVGEWIAVGGPVVELVDTSRLEAVANVPEQYFGGISVGDSATVRVTSIPDLEAAGKVTAVIPSADSEARTFPVKVAFDNPGDRMATGMLVTIDLPQGVARSSILIPKDALVTQGKQKSVFVIEGEPGAETATPRPVTTGAGEGEWIAVDGVSAGERVVTRGNERLFPGMPLQIESIEYPAP